MDAGEGASKDGHRLPSDLHHDIYRSRARGFSGTGTSLSREALFRGGAFRPACRDACKAPPPGVGPDGEGQRQRCPSLLSGHYFCRAFCAQNQHPHDRPENAGHPPELQKCSPEPLKKRPPLFRLRQRHDRQFRARRRFSGRCLLHDRRQQRLCQSGAFKACPAGVYGISAAKGAYEMKDILRPILELLVVLPGLLLGYFPVKTI